MDRKVSNSPPNLSVPVHGHLENAIEIFHVVGRRVTANMSCSTAQERHLEVERGEAKRNVRYFRPEKGLKTSTFKVKVGCTCDNGFPHLTSSLCITATLVVLIGANTLFMKLVSHRTKLLKIVLLGLGQKYLHSFRESMHVETVISRTR